MKARTTKCSKPPEPSVPYNVRIWIADKWRENDPDARYAMEGDLVKVLNKHGMKLAGTVRNGKSVEWQTEEMGNK